MTSPTPAIPTFTDGTVPVAANLNAVGSNLTNLYSYTLAGFRVRKPLCSVSVNAVHAIPTGTDTQVQWDAADVNNDNIWIISNGNFGDILQINTAGTYRLGLQLQHDGAATSSMAVRILVNGTSSSANAVAVAGANADSLSCSATVALASGAAVYAFITQNTGGSVNLKTTRGGCRMTAEWLSP